MTTSSPKGIVVMAWGVAGPDERVTISGIWWEGVSLFQGKNRPECTRHRNRGFDPRVQEIPWRRAGQPTPVLLPGESHGQRSLVCYSP